MNKVNTEMSTGWGLIFICWLLASTATLGSLFFSEVMMFPPCVLCWYQRICMYPLVVILLVGMLPFDGSVFRYSFPLAILGWIIAVYHNLLYYEILPENAAPCLEGVSCTTTFIEWFGFINIPFLSLSAFSLILIVLTVSYRKYRK